MSDGDNATPGRRRRAEDADNQWLTRSPQPLPGAAPWERADHLTGADPAPDEPTGSHADGVTVADLIARMTRTGDAPTPRRSRHRAEPEPDPEPEPEYEPLPEPERPDPTEVIEAVRDIPEDAGYAGDLGYVDAEYVDSGYAEEPGHLEEPVDRDDMTETTVIPVVTDDEPQDDAESPEPGRRSWRASRVLPARAVGRPLDSDPLTEIIEPVRARRHGVKLAGRAAAALLAVLALVLTGGAWQWQSSKNNMLNKVSALDPNSRDILDPNAQFGDENFLIVGIDSRFGDNAQMGAGDTQDAGGARSDTIMLVNIPASRKRVVAVSFPRDLAITPIQCEPWNPETSTYGPLYDKDTGTYGPDEVYTETKLNSAFAFGGPRCLVKVIQKLSGLSINRFMAVDFAGFSKMVDALGGVEVCSTTPLEDYELGTVLPNAGRQIVDGHTALNYVRARQVTTEFNGDYGRIKRQQLFLSSLLRSLISKDTFFSLSKLNNVVNMFISDSYVDNIKTKDLVDLGQSVQGVNAGRISFVTVPTVGYADESGNETPRTDDMRALFDAIINDDPLPGEKNPDNTPVPGSTPSSTSAARSEAPQTATTAPAPADPAPAEMVNAVTTDPQDVTVRVSNSTGADGLAATAAQELQQHGFNVSSPDDYPEALPSTTVFFSPGNEQAAATVASSFANPTIERVSGMGSVVRVVLGSDFHNVNAPTPSGSAVQVNVVHGTSTAHTELPQDLTVTNAADTTCE
ncbi:LCP family protein [Mycolicibacterium brisbanense]|uniref:Cell envelope-related transcriptional attenuator n=1 Tax=Mycolicibacterium brisbanense TaxID=146020 RepID=A0A100W696_9MYCO|nr:LCP family protein [Mycolicibacterium brisbanense]MCV7159602.1 LCP family protein [Mycolicibacterium brisbanense]GAS92396.1 cell envelope-related transcriptional attenuator [Mycolicibacterium brisbanense]